MRSPTTPVVNRESIHFFVAATSAAIASLRFTTPFASQRAEMTSLGCYYSPGLRHLHGAPHRHRTTVVIITALLLPAILFPVIFLAAVTRRTFFWWAAGMTAVTTTLF